MPGTKSKRRLPLGCSKRRVNNSLTLVPLWLALGPNLIDAFSKFVITVYAQCVCRSHKTTLGSPFSPFYLYVGSGDVTQVGRLM